MKKCIFAGTLILSLWTFVASAATLTSTPFGKTLAGASVTQYVMSARDGVSVTFISYGGTVIDVITPDRQGHPGHIVLGFPALRDYETTGAQQELYFGALLGRYTNWISQGRFKLNENSYQITLTDPPNTIHGGKKGFDKRIWTVKPQAASGQSVSALLSYTSADGEEGFPGKLKVSVTYSLTDDGAFTIHYGATTDKDTIISLSNHMNFDLAGAGSPDGVTRHVLGLDADGYLPLDGKQIPLGTIASVVDTPFDFRQPTAIGAHIHDKNQQLAIANGYDQYWVLNKREDVAKPQLAAHVYDPESGRTLDCYTTEPGIQVYTADWFDGSLIGIGGRYVKYGAFTLETQRFPDSPNHANFPSTELKPGQAFSSTTIFRFGVQR